MTSIALYNNKGGVGKTTSAINIAYQLAFDKKVLIIDLDGQANCSRFFVDEPKTGLELALTKSIVAPDIALCATRYPNIDIITATSAINDIVSAFSALSIDKQRENVRKTIYLCSEKYDYILIDLPPALNKITEAVISVSDYVFVPIELSTFAIQGIPTVTSIIADCGAKFGGCFVNKFDRENPADIALMEMLKSTLLRAMENIDRRIEDKELSSYVSERGLGTPATRAAIIERIIKVGYISRKGKSLIAEDKGYKIIDILPPTVKSVELTAEMEQRLAAVENGTEMVQHVLDETIKTICGIIRSEADREHTSLAPKKEPLGKCPICGGSVFEFSKDNHTAFYCENSPKSCYFCLWSDDLFWTGKGKKLTSTLMKSLLTKGKVKVSGLKSKEKDKTYDAIISFSDKTWTDKTGRLHVGFAMEFDNSKKQKKGGK